MPETITITNYSDKDFAHPQFTAIRPGETKSRRVRSVDLDRYDDDFSHFAAAGVVVSFDNIVPKGVVEANGAHTATADDRLVILTASGTVTLPKLADVPQGHRITVAYKDGQGASTVDADGSETIDGQPNLTIPAAGQSVRLRKDSETNWARA